MGTPDILIIPPVQLPPCLAFLPPLPATLDTLLLHLRHHTSIPEPPPIPFDPSIPPTLQDALLEQMDKQMEMAQGCRMFVHGYYVLQEERMGALAALMPDSQMVMDWLEMEYHFRLDVARYSSILVQGIDRRNSIDAMIAWQLYTESMPRLLWLGYRTCPKADRVTVNLESAPSQEERNLERDVMDEWLVSSPQSARDQA